jgi:hypothetical protein
VTTPPARWHCFWGHLARAERIVLAYLNEDSVSEDEHLDTLSGLSLDTDFDDCENCWDSIAHYLAGELADYRSAALGARVRRPTAAQPNPTLPDGFDADAGYEAAIVETCDRISGYLELADEDNPPPQPLTRGGPSCA